jgi:hypothetical protein
MSWLWGGGRAKSPQNGDQSQQQQQTDLRGQRAAQLAALEKNTPGIAMKSADASLYELTMAAPPDGRAVVLRIFLPTRFPEERPGKLKLVPNVLTVSNLTAFCECLAMQLLHMHAKSVQQLCLPEAALHTNLTCTLYCTVHAVTIAVLQLLNQVTHPWVNQYMQVVGHPDLAAWQGVNGKPIAMILAEVIAEFRCAATVYNASCECSYTQHVHFA